jgi:hypothetical protein
MFILSNIAFSTAVGNLGSYFDTFWFSDKWVKTWPMKERRGLCTLGNNKKLQRFIKTLFWFIDGKNSSGSEGDYVLHNQRKLTKDGDQGRIKAASTTTSTRVCLLISLCHVHRLYCKLTVIIVIVIM